MRTFKRTPPEINANLDNYSKYFNQMQFNGINQDKNPYTVDQLSFQEADNVYIDSDDRLVSRPTLQHDELPSKIKIFLEASNYFHLGYILYDIVTIGAGNVYVLQATKNDNKFTICFIPNEGTVNNDTISYITNYHMSIIDHYLICFNDQGAKLIDTNHLESGWLDLVKNKYVEIPVIKRVIGNTITELDKNEFTKSYKQEYIWSAESKPELPETIESTYTLVPGEAKVVSSVGTKEWTLPKAHLGTEYRLLSEINTKVAKYDGNGIRFRDDLFSIAKGRICIAQEDSFLLSVNNGKTFTKVYYPEYPGAFMNIASISEDGLNFFFVAQDGVYRCDLGSLSWGNKIAPYEDEFYGTISNRNANFCYNFKTADIFSFVVFPYGSNAPTIYWKGPGLYMGDDYTKDCMGEINALGEIVRAPYVGFTNFSDSSYGNIPTSLFDNYEQVNRKLAINVNFVNNKYITTICYLTQSRNANNQYGTTLYKIVGGNMSVVNNSNKMYTKWLFNTYDGISTNSSLVIDKLEVIANDGITNSITLRGILTDFSGPSYEPITYKLLTINNSLEESDNIYSETFTITETKAFTGGYTKTPVMRIQPYLLHEWYLVGADLVSIDNTNIKVAINQEFNTDKYEIYAVYVDNDTIYFRLTDGTILTNTLWSDTFATISFLSDFSNKPYTKVPSVSYSDTNLYLGFGDLLQITQNTKDPNDLTKTLFNLPAINNQSFIDNITGMINISSTEVALFFKDKITICAKVEDSNLATGYRYDYFNTKLSTGIRLGDIVMNSLEGSFTIFPTRRGLAAMNYQAFMATSDQVISYITDAISELWTEFYDASEKIHIIQWRTKLVLTNGTGTILIYYFNTNTWWKWTVPVNVSKSLTDQIDLRLIKDTLLIFKDDMIVNNELKTLRYYDFSKDSAGVPINWSLISQPLHMSAPNYYKNIRQLIFQFFDTGEKDVTKTFLAQVKLYRKRVTVRDPEIVKFKVDELRTFVKRFNYWKINELQWGLKNDENTVIPDKFELNGITIKYELGEEVR